MTTSATPSLVPTLSPHKGSRVRVYVAGHSLAGNLVSVDDANDLATIETNEGMATVRLDQVAAVVILTS